MIGEPGEPRVAWVTGGSRGIGRAAAIDLARHGFHVVVFARSLERPAESYAGTLTETVEDIRRLRGAATAIGADLSDLDEIRRAAAVAIEAAGPPDVLVTAANIVDFESGGTYVTRFLDTDWARIERHLRFNCLGTPLLIHLAAPHMVERGHGVIINITQHRHGSLQRASVDGPMPGSGASGFAVPVSRGVTDRIAPILARELEPAGVCVVTLDPGMTLSVDPTRLDAVERVGYRRDLAHSVAVPARAITFLAADTRRMRFSGHLVEASDLVREFELLTAAELERPWEDGVRDVRELPVMGSME